MKILIIDFEVFKYDTLLGVLILNDKDNTITKYQTWDLQEIKKFYFDNKNSLWVGHNNIGYDNLILEAIVCNKNPYLLSKRIVKEQ